MDPNSHNKTRDKLKSQISEAYGKVVYTYTCHNYMENRFTSRNTWIRVVLIILSSLTLGSFLLSAYPSEHPDWNYIALIIGLILSLITLIFNVYLLSFNCVDTAGDHRKTSDSLWKIMAYYTSLLTDFDSLDDETIRQKRDELVEKTDDIYASAPRTDRRAYKRAQKALKLEGEQSFSEAEIDSMLPMVLRNAKNK